MSVRYQPIAHYHFSSEKYSFKVIHFKNESVIQLQMHNGVYTTSSLPSTYRILQKMLPNIFTSECFNEENLPFSKEVQNTEIAHLFEHILLEYYCAIQSARGKKTIVNGVTSWNWYTSPMGSFTIKIDKGLGDKMYILKAIKHSIRIFDTVLLSSVHSSVYRVN